MHQRALDHKSSIVSTLEIANERVGVDIQVFEQDWANAKVMQGSFLLAVETLE